MADETLQAFQLGASLYDRAQTQKRMMEQMQMNAADQVMRQRQYDLQNKVQSFALARAMKDQEDELADADNMALNVQSVDQFFVNPDAPFPIFKPVKSAKNQAILNQYRQQLDDFSERSKLMRGVAASKNALLGQLNSAYKWAEDNNQYDIIHDNNNGLDQYGNPDPQKIRQIYSVLGPKIQASQNLSRASKLADFASESAINASSETPEVKAQAISIFRAKKAEQFPKDVRNLMLLGNEEAIRSAPAADSDVKEAAIKALQSAEKAKLAKREPLKAALEDWKSAPPERKNEAFQLLQAQASKSRKDVFISPSGEVEFKPELPSNTRQNLISGIRSSNAAIKEIDRLNDSQIENAFGTGSSLNVLGQNVGLSGVNLGLNQDQIEIQSVVELLKTFVSRGLLDEKGVKSDRDAAAAGRVLNADFRKLSPDQFRQQISTARRLFSDSIERMKSPLGLVALEEVKSPAVKVNTAQNVPSVSATDSMSEISFKSIDEALAKGKKSGDSVIINGVPGKLK